MRILLLIIIVTFLSGCEKAKEKIGASIIMDALTDGLWVVTKYESSTTVYTNDLSPYKFQFRENHTVEAIKDGNIVKTGTWQDDVNNMIMTTNFSGSYFPISLMNGPWHITDHGWTYVDAEQTINGQNWLLHLEKQ